LIEEAEMASGESQERTKGASQQAQGRQEAIGAVTGNRRERRVMSVSREPEFQSGECLARLVGSRGLALLMMGRRRRSGAGREHV
jgi:hypothetical protein